MISFDHAKQLVLLQLHKLLRDADSDETFHASDVSEGLGSAVPRPLVDRALSELVEEGWVATSENGLYFTISNSGIRQVDRALADVTSLISVFATGGVKALKNFSDAPLPAPEPPGGDSLLTSTLAARENCAFDLGEILQHPQLIEPTGATGRQARDAIEIMIRILHMPEPPVAILGALLDSIVGQGGIKDEVRWALTSHGFLTERE